MDIRSMRFVLTLADELHFGRAAQRHYISGQAFGRAVAQLEKELGARLFTRTSRRVGLTAAGERYVHRARSVLAELDEMSAVTARQPAEHDGLVVGVLGFGLAERWPDLRRALAESRPDLRLAHRELDYESQYEAVRRGEVDVGVVMHVGPVDGLVFDELVTGARVAVVPAWSDLADAERLGAADVDGREWIPYATRSHPAINEWLGPASEHSRSAPVVRSPAAITSAVATTGALGVFAETARRFYPHPAVRFVPLDGEPCTVAVASRVGDDRPAVAAFRRAARLVHAP